MTNDLHQLISKYIHDSNYRGLVSKVSKSKQLSKQLLNNTLIFDNFSCSQRLYHVIHKLYDRPICYCGAFIKYKNITLGYFKYCSKKCAVNSETTIIKIKNTNNKLYGHDWFTQTDRCKEIVSNNNTNNISGFGSQVSKAEILSRYGVHNISQLEYIKQNKIKIYQQKNDQQKNDIKQKYINTCMLRYGVPNPTLNPDIFCRNIKLRLDWKDCILPSGKLIRVQGYENLALDLLLTKYHETDIITDLKNITKKIGGYITYKYQDKIRKYYPDIYIKSTNTIIEVKSTYTFNLKKEQNLLKQNACLIAGYNFNFMIFDKNKKIIL